MRERERTQIDNWINERDKRVDKVSTFYKLKIKAIV